MAQIRIAQWLAKDRGIGRHLDVVVKRETAKAILVDATVHVEGGSNFCCICGRTLTNRISRFMNIGPICAERFGLDRPEKLTDEELLEYFRSKASVKDMWIPKSQMQLIEGDLTPVGTKTEPRVEERWLKTISPSELRLKVSFHEREQAKSIFGCKGWDGEMKAWKFVNDPFVLAQISSIWPEFAQQEPVQAVELDSQLDKRLYKYQREGIKKLVPLSGLLLGDDMGVGKTPQLIQTAKALNAESTLVVCPAQLKWNWRNEIKKWWPEARVQIVDGDVEDRRAQLFEAEADVFVANYESFFTRIEVTPEMRKKNKALAKSGQKFVKVIMPGLDKLFWDILILDEAHKVKDRKSNNTKAMKALRRQADRCYLATGTPILNSAQELWSLLNILYPKVFTSFWSFVEEFCIVYNNGYGTEIVDIVELEDPRIQKLRKLIDPIFLRRTKEEVFPDMPEKIVTKVPIRLDDEQIRNYMEMEEKMLTECRGETIFSPIAMAQIVRLKQICIDPTLMIEDCTDPLSGPKVDAALEIIESAGGNKVVVFSQWSRVVNRFAKTLRKKKIECDVITGEVDGEERQRLVDDFQNDGETQVLVCTTEAGGVGINLTAADSVIFFDKLWTPKINEQAEDRVHRHGQTKTVNIWYLHAENTVEDAIEEVLNHKTKVSDIIIERT